MARKARPTEATTDYVAVYEDWLIATYHKYSPYWRQIVGGVVIIILVALFITNNRQEQRSSNAKAFAELNAALAKSEIDDRQKELDRVAREFAATAAGIDAEFHKSTTAFAAGDYATAAQSYRAFYEKHPQSMPFTTLAYIGEANCLMAQHQFADAKEKFIAISRDPERWGGNIQLKHQATYRAAVCDFTVGQFDDARTTLEALLNDLQPETSANEAESSVPNSDEQLRERVTNLLTRMTILPANEILPVVTAELQDDGDTAAQTDDADTAQPVTNPDGSGSN